MTTRYSVIGLGKLGASILAAIASRGQDAIGVDVSPRAVDAINAGLAPVQETDLSETIAANREHLAATLSCREAVLASDVTFVVVPTPSDRRGAFSLQQVASAFTEIGQALAHKDGYHLVVLTSTVLPGATRYGLLPVLERASGKVCGQDFGLCYSPEFIALGSVIHDFLHPDFTLVGEHDERAGSALEACYAELLCDRPPCHRMSIENAELAKIALNAYVTTKITFANMLADLCERIPGGDVDAVTGALGADRRIGPRYLKGALGYGGPCFPRDNLALSFSARALGTQAELAMATDAANRCLPERILARLRPILRPGMVVAILGLAYKPLTCVVEESQAIRLAQLLAREGAHVIGYDPLAGKAAEGPLSGVAMVVDTLEACLEQAEIVLITTPDPAFRALTAASFAHAHGEVAVVDFWRILPDALAGRRGIRYLPVGLSTDDATNSGRLAELWQGAVG
jgi:UDPglucose 6-dehydrogenase